MKPKYKKYETGGMIAAGVQAGLGVAQSIYGLTQAKKAKADIRNLQQNAPSLSTPSEYFKAVKEAYDQRLVQMQYEELGRSLSTTINALQGAGGRALVGGINQATRQTSRAMEEMALRQNQMQQQALGNLASAREREIGREDERYQMNLGFANQNLRDAYAQVAGGLSSTAEGVMFGELMNKKKPARTNDFKVSYEGLNTADEDQLRNLFAEEPEFKKGGMITKGSFSHDKNPIDVVHKGKKVAELTGQEAVLNPKQQEIISKQSPYAKKLFAKFKKEVK